MDHTMTLDLPSRPQLRSRYLSASQTAEVRDGLLRKTREVPAVFLTDHTAMAMRRAVMSQANERMQVWEAPLVQAWCRAHRATHPIDRVVELAPTSETVDALLNVAPDQPPVSVYLAVDASLDVAAESAARVRDRWPETVALSLATNPALTLPLRRASATAFCMFGGAFGRYSPVTAVRVLRSVRRVMSTDDRLLLGLDMRSVHDRGAGTPTEVATRTAWYRQALQVANRELGTNVDVNMFSHVGRPDSEQQRTDEGLVCARTVRVDGPAIGSFTLRPGELLRMQGSWLYAEEMVRAMARGVGLSFIGWHLSLDGAHALADLGVSCSDDREP